MLKNVIFVIAILFTSTSIGSSEDEISLRLQKIKNFNKLLKKMDEDPKVQKEVKEILSNKKINEIEKYCKRKEEYQNKTEIFISCIKYFYPYLKNPYFISGSAGLFLGGPIGAIAFTSMYWSYSNWDYIFQKENEANISN